jgi:hypothetical protein
MYEAFFCEAVITNKTTMRILGSYPTNMKYRESVLSSWKKCSKIVELLIVMMIKIVIVILIITD